MNQELLAYLNSLGINSNFKSITEAIDSLRYNREKNKSGLVSISDEIYNSKNTVSIEFHLAGVGAYLSTWNDYLTLSTLTGNRLSLDSLIIEGSESELTS